ncbi:HEAT repeat domain-containing protein [Okeania sp. SIO1F9]|uniref:HEAT repeat domain-containing protein n=1 Tax=Okeania sp. SIO1F9 TaxID=2607813 RepID=UPI00257BBD61|nr:HEAT repeat domain-containing protein [Okeania sp. SIO1F9]
MAGLTKSDAAVPGLVKLLEDSDKYVRRGAEKALGEIRSKTAVPGLIKLLEDSDYLVRYSAEKALGEIGSETAIPELIKLLENSDSGVHSAAEALGEIGSETAIPELIKLLENSDSGVRHSAAEALGKIGSETAIPELIKLLENSDSGVRETVENTLGKIGSETVIFELTKLLEHSNTDLRKTAAYLIEIIGSKSVNSKSIKHSEYRDYDYDDYKMSCIYSQDEIDPKSAIRSLIIFLKYKCFSSIFSSSIADALAELIDSEIAIHGPIKPLEHPEDIEYPEEIEYIDIISGVINDLSKIGSELAIEVLIKILILNKYDTDLLFTVADASQKIVSEAAITSLNKVMIPIFIELLEDEDTDPDIYYRAVDILLDIDSPSVIPGLIQLLKSSDHHVRSDAAYALDCLGSENTIIELNKKLQSDSFFKASIDEIINIINSIQQRLQYYKPTPKIPMSNTLSHNYALLIGIGNCKDSDLSLPVTVKDVQAIKSFLTNPDLCGYINNQNHLRLLCNEQATKQNILDNLNWLQQQAKNDSKATILVYYSGHGWLDNSTQNYYLIPHDTTARNRKVTASTALPATEFNSALQQISAQKLLVIIDSCHAQGMATAKETEELELPENFSQTALPKNLIDELRKGTGRAVFTSSTGEEKSYYQEEMSIYTQHFLEALNGGGNKPGDKEVKVSNLMNYVGKTVPESAGKLGGKQTPIFDFSQVDDFPVALLCGGKGLPDGGWEEVKSEVRENIRAGRDVYNAGGDNTSQINVFGSSETTITIGDISSK